MIVGVGMVGPCKCVCVCRGSSASSLLGWLPSPPDFLQMSYVNHEGVPEAEDIVDYFMGVTLFKRHHFSVGARGCGGGMPRELVCVEFGIEGGSGVGGRCQGSGIGVKVGQWCGVGVLCGGWVEL